MDVEIVEGHAEIPLSNLTKSSYDFQFKNSINNYTDIGHYYVRLGNNTDNIISTISKDNIPEDESVLISLNAPASYRHVDVYVDGVFYSSYRLNIGEVMVSVGNLSVGKHNITLTNNFNYAKNFKISVSKPKTTEKTNSNPVKPSKPVIKLTLKKVKVKKSAKKLVLTATLKINGAVAKNKRVTFKFNKKTYDVKTNGKGIVKVTINKSVLKKLKVGKKVKYQVIYSGNVKSYSVKVQK